MFFSEEGVTVAGGHKPLDFLHCNDSRLTQLIMEVEGLETEQMMSIVSTI